MLYKIKYSYTIFLYLILTDSYGQSVQQFTVLPKLSIRALEVINDKTAWFAANRGVWGFTENSGKTWHIDSIKADSVYPQFRSIAALNDSTILVLSIASPGYLLKTTNKGKTWKTVFKDGHPKTFYDCLVFSDTKNGIAIGDPIEQCLQMICTKDGGNTWTKKECNTLPLMMDGEAFFATSNSNIDIYKNNVWFVSGGKRSRVFHSNEREGKFESFNSPIPQGETMTGIFSFDFYNETLGVVTGGNYDKTDTSVVSLALTHNGGKNWTVIKGPKPFFGSCVRFKNAKELWVTGHNGTFCYNLKKQRVEELKDKEEALNYYTLRFSPSGKTMWMAGSDGRICILNKK